MVELHSRLSYVRSRGTAWQDLSLASGTAHGRPVWLLEPAAELVYLLVHCYQHLPFSLLQWVDEILQLSERLPPRPLPEVPAMIGRFRSRNVVVAVTTILRAAIGADALPQIDVGAVAASRLRLRLHQALFVPRNTDLFTPLPGRAKWLEKLRPLLLADTLADGFVDFARTLRVHFYTRWPTRIPPG